MSAEWQKALIFSILFHLALAIGMIVLSSPIKPRQQRVVKISLKSATFKAIEHRKAVGQKATKQKKAIKHTKSTRQKGIYRSIKSRSKKKDLHTTKRLYKSKNLKSKNLMKKVTRKTKEPLSSHEMITQTEEDLLRRRLASLKARAEKRRLCQKLAALSKRTAGLSLSGEGISKDILARMAAHLKAFWEVPVILKDRLDLSAEVELEIAPDGKILSWHFLRSSGEPLFDEAVKSTIKKADPLPPPGRHLILPAIFKIEED